MPLPLALLLACHPAGTPGVDDPQVDDTAPVDSPTDTHDSPVDTSDSVETPVEWSWLHGVWNAKLAYTDPFAYESVASVPFRFVVSGDVISATSGSVTYDVTTTEDPQTVTLHVEAGGPEQDGGSYTYVEDIVLTERADDDTLVGVYAESRHVYDADGDELFGEESVAFAEFGRVDRIDATPTQGLTLLGSAIPTNNGEYAVNVRVQDGYAYLPHYADGLFIYDVRDPAAITLVGTSPAGSGDWNDVKLYASDERTYAMVASSTDGLVVVDVTDPTAPVVVNALPGVGGMVHTLAIEGTTAYLATLGSRGRGGGLVTVDITDPASPVVLGEWLAAEAGGSFVHDLFIDDGIAYLCAWEGGLVLVDVTDPTNLQRIAQVEYDPGNMTSHSVWVTDAPGRKVALEGGEGWGTHLRIIDVDPTSADYLQVIGELALPEQVSIHNIMMGSGTTAVVAWYQYGVRLVDISDPTQPTMVGWAQQWDPEDPRNGAGYYEGAVGVDVVDDKVYVADIWDDLLVYGVE